MIQILFIIFLCFVDFVVKEILLLIKSKPINMNDQAKFSRHDTGAFRKRKTKENETPEQRKACQARDWIISFDLFIMFYQES